MSANKSISIDTYRTSNFRFQVLCIFCKKRASAPQVRSYIHTSVYISRGSYDRLESLAVPQTARTPTHTFLILDNN